ncbi:MAG: 50S ribosomal protein L29, partial [Bacteroidia bacterium]|nr:50S ribosomal protein L29 [Bacteroidia bacterium]
MKVNHGVSPLENPILLRINRRNIARLLTEATKRKATKK